MNKLKLLRIAIVMTSMTLMTGCSVFPERYAHMNPGSIAEIAAPVTVTCNVTNIETGKKEKRKVEVWPGYYLVRPRLQEFGKEKKEGSKDIAD